jgi:threonine/homoserine/homoserine lactone efflux protein
MLADAALFLPFFFSALNSLAVFFTAGLAAFASGPGLGFSNGFSTSSNAGFSAGFPPVLSAALAVVFEGTFEDPGNLYQQG